MIAIGMSIVRFWYEVTYVTKRFTVLDSGHGFNRLCISDAMNIVKE